MNRKNLTAAVLAGLAGAAGIVGSAQAVNINPDGLGQVLLYPYYTTNGGNTTILSVVNTSDEAKAVKVRFLEGENSREVLDFNLYMSAYDVWTAALYDDAGTPTMVTNDTSCTVPYIYGNGGVQAFLPWALDDAGYLDNHPPTYAQSNEFDDISRGAEGHFEMIEMGTLTNDAQTDNPAWVDVGTYAECNGPVQAGHPVECLVPRLWSVTELAAPQYLTAHASADAVTHDATGVPANCQQLVDAWTDDGDVAVTTDDGYWIQNAFDDLEAPSGGLFGGAAIVNVSGGTMYSYDARAVDGFATSVNAADVLHQEPGTILPSLDSGNVTTGTVFVEGDTIESVGLNRGVDAVSYVFMHDQIMNEYTTESIVGAGTEWVITFPTKQFYVHQAFLDDYEVKFRSGNANNAPDAAVDPFTSTWTWVDSVYDDDDELVTAGYVDRPCEIVQLDTIWDREEQTIVPEDAPPGTPIPPIVSPAPPPTTTPGPPGVTPFELCYETSVIQFGAKADVGDTSEILGSSNFHNIDNVTDLGFDYGWARLNLYNSSWDSDKSGAVDEDEITYRDDLGGLVGLPVTGFAVQRFENSFLGEGADVLANYGGIFQHKGTRSEEFRGK